MVESTGLENRRCESIRGFESHPLRQANFIQSSAMQKYPSGRRGSPAKGVGCVKSAARVQIPPSAPDPAAVVAAGFLFAHRLQEFSFCLPSCACHKAVDMLQYTYYNIVRCRDGRADPALCRADKRGIDPGRGKTAGWDPAAGKLWVIGA